MRTSFADMPTVPCKYCGTPTNMTATKLCDGCWETERRITNNPDLARRILDNIEKDEPNV